MRFSRPLGIAGIITVLLSSVVTGSAGAAVTTGCGGLQSAMDEAPSGTVITLNRMCSGKTYTLPTNVQLTLQGTPGAGFDGNGTVGPLLSGTNVKGTVIRNLIFRDGAADTGQLEGVAAAISIEGNSFPKILNSRFINNATTEGGAVAGAVSIFTNSTNEVRIANNVFGGAIPASGNRSDLNAGALSLYFESAPKVVVSNNLFRNNTSALRSGGLHLVGTAGGEALVSGNTFLKNHSGEEGGGMFVQFQGEISYLNNVFRENTLDAGSEDTRRGGALSIQALGATTVIQRGNLLVGNSIGTTAHAQGAGEYLFMGEGATFRSRNDRILMNSAASPDAKGGGLFVFPSQADPVKHTLTNLVVAGNTLGANGQGGGIYTPLQGIDCASNCAIHLEIRNSTISGNTVGAGGEGSQIIGGLEDRMDIYNSIVYQDGSNSDLFGVGMGTTSYSDICYNGAPNVGTGMVCVDPQLRDPNNGDIHQTPTSPTRDIGSNALIPSVLSTDFEGQLRIMDSDASGSRIVDMGADEAKGKALLSIGFDKTRDNLRVKGRLLPRNPGKSVVIMLFRKVAGVFKKLSSTSDQLNSESRYAVTFARPRKGDCKARVSFPGSPTTLPGVKTKTFDC